MVSNHRKTWKPKKWSADGHWDWNGLRLLCKRDPILNECNFCNCIISQNFFSGSYMYCNCKTLITAMITYSFNFISAVHIWFHSYIHYQINISFTCLSLELVKNNTGTNSKKIAYNSPFKLGRLCGYFDLQHFPLPSRLSKTNFTLICPSLKLFVCYVPDSGRHVTRPGSLSRSWGRGKRDPGNNNNERL